MKTSEFKKLIREEIKKTIKEENGIAKTGTYEIRYITDDAGNKLYSVYLDGEQFGDRYSGSGTIPSGYKNATPTDVLRKLLGRDNY